MIYNSIGLEKVFIYIQYSSVSFQVFSFNETKNDI